MTDDWTEAMDERLRTYRDAGYSILSIASHMGISRDHIRRRMTQLAMPSHKDPPPLEPAKPYRPGLDPRPKFEA